MPIDFYGPLLKVDRAQHHIDKLEAIFKHPSPRRGDVHPPSHGGCSPCPGWSPNGRMSQGDEGWLEDLMQGV
jgi:hypothetical protein